MSEINEKLQAVWERFCHRVWQGQPEDHTHKEPCEGCGKNINAEYCWDTLIGAVLCDPCHHALISQIEDRFRRWLNPKQRAEFQRLMQDKTIMREGKIENLRIEKEEE